MKKNKEKTEILQGLSSITQLGLSVAVPPILCIFLALWLQKKFSVGDWIVPVCLAVGLISGICSFASFIRTARYKAEKKEAPRDEDRQDR